MHASQASPEQLGLQLPAKGIENYVYEFPFPPLPPLLMLLALLSLQPTSCSLKRGFLWMLARHPSSPWLEEPCPVLLGFCVPWLSQTGSPGTRRSQGGCKAIRRAVRSGCSYLHVKSRDVAMSELQSEVWGTQVEWQLLT